MKTLVMLAKIPGGRDFVTTDPHGMNPAVFRQLIADNQLTRTDRLFICGDIIDKGQHSEDLVEFIIANNETHAKGANVPEIVVTIGNHEAMFLCWYAETHLEKNDQKVAELKKFFGDVDYANNAESFTLHGNSGQWALEMEFAEEGKERLKRYFNFFYDLPLIARVQGEDDATSYNFVHADLPRPMAELIPQHGTASISDPKETTSALWARLDHTETYPQLTRPDGSGITFCGHTYDVPMLSGNGYYNLDCCSASSRAVILIECQTMQVSIVHDVSKKYLLAAEQCLKQKSPMFTDVTDAQLTTLKEQISSYKQQLIALKAHAETYTEGDKRRTDILQLHTTLSAQVTAYEQKIAVYDKPQVKLGCLDLPLATQTFIKTSDSYITAAKKQNPSCFNAPVCSGLLVLACNILIGFMKIFSLAVDPRLIKARNDMHNASSCASLITAQRKYLNLVNPTPLTAANESYVPYLDLAAN